MAINSHAPQAFNDYFVTFFFHLCYATYLEKLNWML